jgi:colanic acid biosynthesis glycosyl transferase WcaI
VHLLLYALNFAPELTGCGKYAGEMAAWLVARGHQVSVVTAPPYYPDWKVAAGYTGWRYQRQSWPVPGSTHGLRLVRCPLWVPRRVTGARRVVHLASFAVSSTLPLAMYMARRPDLLMLVLPTLACAPWALACAKALGVPAWAHVQDFEVDAAFDLGLVDRVRGRDFALRAERAMLRGFGRVSSITPKMVERLRAKGVSADRTVLLPNWVDLTAVYPLAGPNALRAELGIAGDGLLCLYAGNMGEKQGLELLVETARRLQGDRRLHFVMVGDGAARARLRAQAAGLANVRWLPIQPLERLNLMLNAADVHLLPQRADAADLVMPSKLTGMLASGRVVLGTAAQGTQLAGVLEEVGVRTVPGDVDAFVRALLGLAASAARREALGAAGRRYAELHLGIDGIMDSFVRAVDVFCGPGARGVERATDV